MFGKILSYKQHKNQILIDFEFQKGIVEIINENIIRIYANLEREIPSFAIENIQIEPTNITCLSFEKGIKIITKKLIIHIYDNFKVDFLNKLEKVICEDYKGKRLPFIRHAISLSESESEKLAAKKVSEGEGHQTKDYFDHHKIEVLKTNFEDNIYYGLGEKTGFLNKKGYEYEMWNTDDPSAHLEYFKSLYKSVPFFITKNETATYGIYFDNTYRTYFDMGKENNQYIYFGADNGNLDYYFIYGKDLKDVVTLYTTLTGTTPLPKRKTLGYHQSRWSYGTKERVEQIINGFKENALPLDFVHLDIDYMDEYKIFTYDNKRFENLNNAINEWKKQGIEIITIIDPGTKVEDGYSVFEEGKKDKLFLTRNNELYINRVWPGKSVYPDFSKIETRKWWEKKQKKMIDLGVSGIWNDMNEPASFDGPLLDDVEFDNNGLGANHLEMHNVYGHLMAKATYNGIKEATNERPFVITRASFAGSQKYSTFWTGDNQSLWIHLQMAVPMLCNMGLSGYSFVGTDVGGFGGDVTFELLCRWVQVGAFSPLFRNHSSMMTRDQEPFAFDEKTLNIYRKFLKLRYRLIPYYYDLFYHGEKNGLPVFRPIVLNYPSDPETFNLNDEFMIGESLLVSPILEQGKNHKLVYLPHGNWYDYFTGEILNGSSYHIKYSPLDTCPLFVKAGSIIPNYEDSLFVKDYYDSICFDIYPGNTTYYHLLDDGKSFNYQKGIYTLYKIEMNTNESLKIDVSLENNQYKTYQNINIKIHVDKVTNVLVDGIDTPFTKNNHIIEFSVNGNKHSIIIK